MVEQEKKIKEQDREIFNINVKLNRYDKLLAEKDNEIQELNRELNQVKKDLKLLLDEILGS